jgi:endo-1,4-beta-xylanase
MKASMHCESMKWAIPAMGMLLAASATQAQMAKGDCKYFGNIITNGVPSDYNTYWNQASPENSGKWSSVQSSVKSTSYNWSGFQTVYDWGKSTGNPVKFHVLVWGSQQPSDASSATISDIQKWFEAVHTKFPDLQQIDVVNEAYPSHAPAQYKGVLKTAAASDGIPSGDYDWIFEAFKMARKLWTDPAKTKLIYNDYNTIEYDSEYQWVVKLAQAAKAQNIPIDAIGCQAHDAYKVSTSSVKTKIDGIAAVGFPIYITEYDIGESDDTKQKNIMQEQVTMYWNDPNVKGVTYWGIKAGQTWRTGTGVETSSGAERPSLTWLKSYLPANKGNCGTDAIQVPVATLAPATAPGMVMRNVNGRLVMGIERNGQFTAMSALGRN